MTCMHPFLISEVRLHDPQSDADEQCQHANATWNLEMRLETCTQILDSGWLSSLDDTAGA